jgi:hypothetical protein
VRGKTAALQSIIMNTSRLYRVILPVNDLDTAVPFYAALLEQPGFRVSGGRHYSRIPSATRSASWTPPARRALA